MFKSKEEKNTKKMEKFLQKYHLENIDEKDLEAIEEIAHEYLGLGKFGTILSLKVEEQSKIQHLSVLTKQNWMIIKKLDEISRKL